MIESRRMPTRLPEKQIPSPAIRSARGETLATKETNPASHIVQVSLSIACLEEGLHIPRVMEKLTKRGTLGERDLLVVISDNGSRGAMELIESENNLAHARSSLLQQLQTTNPTLAEGFGEYVQKSARLRNLQMKVLEEPTIPVLHEYSSLLTSQPTLIDTLTQGLPASLSAQFYQYAQAEDLQRSALATGLKTPEEIISRAEEKEHYHYTHHLKGTDAYEKHKGPKDDQLETIRAYSQILSGKYQDDPNVRVQLVGGSETGSFGSARKFGVEAIERDFDTHHPGVDLQSHAVVGGFDMDSDFSEDLPGKIATSFEANPQAKLILPDLDGTEDLGNGVIGETSRSKWLRRLPGYRKIGIFLVDQLNGEAYFGRENRTSRHYAPAGVAGISAKKFGYPNLHIGPFICVRGDAMKQAPFEEVAAQGEDFFETIKLRRLYPQPQHEVHDPNIVIHFNFRGYLLRELLNYMNEESQDRGVVPYKHKVLEAILKEKFPEFHNRLNGHMKRETLVGELTRRIEEERYGLSPNEYLVTQIWDSQRAQRRQSRKLQSNERIIIASDVPLKQDVLAVVAKVDGVELAENEYISKRIHTEKQRQKILRGKYKGERIITVDGKDYLVRTHMHETDDLPERIRIAQFPTIS